MAEGPGEITAEQGPFQLRNGSIRPLVRVPHLTLSREGHKRFVERLHHLTQGKP
jgi:hypothetical protein